ncbi:MAG: formylglycine-generating enzyme family protein [Deltaproteobacteria bacterium]|nr:formylglycine-generating enzyme family protein [Deltaproteobacteria bacterium]
MELILIPAGEFLMGSVDGYDPEKPVRRVQISQPFYLGKYPVTQAQWQEVMGNHPSRFTGDLNRPVERVSWDDAQEFLRKLSEREKGKPYRLPTEAEWEYAARAGTATAYCFGDDPERLPEYAWYDKNSAGTTHPVGQLTPDAWGLYDVHGNVWEWVQDWFVADYYQLRPNPDRDPRGPDKGDYRLLRGGSWDSEAGPVRVAGRSWVGPGYWSASVGFRCAQ